MTLLQILTDICSRVGDVRRERYNERAKDHLSRAISNLLPEASQDDIPGYYLPKTDLTFATNPAELKTLKVYRVKSIHLPPTVIAPYVGTFTFAAATKTINDDAVGNFTTLGFLAGDKIIFSGTGALNVTELTIVSIQNDAGTLDQITVSEVIVNDASISGTLSVVPLDITVTYIERDQVANMHGIESLQPTANDVFVYKVGNKLFAVVSTDTVIALATQVFHMWYIQDFDITGIADSYDFNDGTTNYDFSPTFLRQAIDLASKSLLDEVNT